MEMDETLDQGSTFDLNNGTETHSIFVKLLRYANGKSLVNFDISKALGQN